MLDYRKVNRIFSYIRWVAFLLIIVYIVLTLAIIEEIREGEEINWQFVILRDYKRQILNKLSNGILFFLAPEVLILLFFNEP